MKTEIPLTIGHLKEWCAENNLSDDIPLGIYLGDSERGSVAYGIVAETENVIDEDGEIENLSETTGEHCYCKNVDVLSDLYDVSTDKQIVMITDGCHIESK